MGVHSGPADQALAGTEAKGYKRWQHHEKDAKVKQYKHIGKTIGKHEKVLNFVSITVANLLIFSSRYWLGHL